MKNITILSRLLVLSVLLPLASCEVIGGIFKAGAVFGILIVVAILGLIFFIFSKMSNK